MRKISPTTLQQPATGLRPGGEDDAHRAPARLAGRWLGRETRTRSIQRGAVRGGWRAWRTAVSPRAGDSGCETPTRPYAEPATGRSSRWARGGVGRWGRRTGVGRRASDPGREARTRPYTTARGAVGRRGWRTGGRSSGRRLRSRNSDKTLYNGARCGRTAGMAARGRSSGRRLQSRNSDKTLYNGARCGRTARIADWGRTSGRRLRSRNSDKTHTEPATGRLSRWSRGAVGAMVVSPQPYTVSGGTVGGCWRWCPVGADPSTTLGPLRGPSPQGEVA
jgi:hypothetical protein